MPSSSQPRASALPSASAPPSAFSLPRARPAVDGQGDSTPSQIAVELQNVTFRRGETQILRSVDLQIRSGEHWALLGPNGAGKTTILGFCGAQLHPTSGTVDVLGERLGRVDMQQLRRRIGHVNPRHPLRSTLPVIDVVLTGITGTIERPNRWNPSDEDVRQADELIHELGLEHRRDARWPILSQGERGRALIARALIARPDLLLLDEPTTGLDVAAREQFLETVDDLRRRQPQLTTILVTHHLEELPASTTHALLISGGQIVAAGPADTALTSENTSAAFEYPIQVIRDDNRWVARSGRR